MAAGGCWGSTAVARLCGRAFCSTPLELLPFLPCLQLPYGPSSQQYRWAAAQLAGVSRTATPWLLVLMHGAPRTTFVPSFQASTVGARSMERWAG